jgi:GMP synthase-like glutamine amidotransferase
MLRIHIVQHAPFETPGYIENLCQATEGVKIAYSCLYSADPLPALSEFDLLIVMGGPMNVDEHELYPWLVSEKQFILESIQSNKKVLGICLGAQLIAAALGAKVQKNEFKEIGWYPVYRTTESSGSALLKGIPDTFFALHWHGDTFQIPQGARRIAASGACGNQGFVFKDSVIGLQFHLEVTENTLQDFLSNCKSDLVEGKYIQTEKEMLAQGKALITQTNQYMSTIFNNLLSVNEPQSGRGS